MPITNGTVVDSYPDVYVSIVPPPPPTVGVRADVVVAVGTASRGPVNVPIWTSGPAEHIGYFGGETPSVADPNTPLTLFPTFNSIATERPLDKACLRVGGSDMATASVTLSNGTGDMARLWASSPGTWAANMTVQISPDANATTFTLLVSNPVTQETETISGLLPGATAADNAALIVAINNNIVYSKSKLLYATQPVLDSPNAAPTLTGASTGGTVAPGPWYGIVEIVNAVGRTQGSPETVAVTLTAPGTLSFTVPAVTGGASWNGYLAQQSGAETFAINSSTFGAPVTLTAPWTPSTQTPAFGPVDTTGALIAARTGAGATGAVPVAATLTFPAANGTAKTSAGINGGRATSAQYVGVTGAVTTGLYALAGAANIDPNFVALGEAAGCDPTTYAIQAAIAHQNNWIAVCGLPRGTSPMLPSPLATILSTIGASADGDYITWGYPWVQTKELSYYKTDVTAAGHAHYAGAMAAQPPNVSAMFKPLASEIEGVEIPLTRDQAKLVSGLQTNGPWVNPVVQRPGGGFTFLTNTMASGKRAFVVRMQLLLAVAAQQEYLFAIGNPNDARLWRRCQIVGTQYLDGLARAGYIPANPAPGNATPPIQVVTVTAKGKVVGAQPSTATPTAASAPTQMVYGVQCDAANNTVGAVITSDLYVTWWVDLAPNVERAIVTLNATTGLIVPAGI